MSIIMGIVALPFWIFILSKWLPVAGSLLLHILPLFVAGSFSYWLACGHWM